jgi:subtilisin family serine protease
MGTDTDVERLLCVPRLKECGMDGSGVLVAIVDTGVNVSYLNSHGKNPTFDATRSWTPVAGLVPGSLPVDHGTMCAFDACIAAPNCTLLDIALLQSGRPGRTILEGFLSDAVLAYRHLLDIMLAPKRPGESRSMVVNNSWGMFDPSWDFPVGDPGNYSDNPNHPFNRIVGALECAGADILFAAGNCGANCPDGRCQGVTANAIYGANSHPLVLSIAGVDTSKARVGYSSIGPGRLTQQKPDLSSYTHFKGSGVYAADGGTSAATPVASGVVAALRSELPYDASLPQTSPAAIRNMLIKTAEDAGLLDTTSSTAGASSTAAAWRTRTARLISARSASSAARSAVSTATSPILCLCRTSRARSAAVLETSSSSRCATRALDRQLPRQRRLTLASTDARTYRRPGWRLEHVSM